jgi:DNA-binding beta-propeller fold protein YncE
LLRIDPVTNRVAAQTYPVGKDPTAVAVGEGSVWVANAGDKSILRLDPATGKLQATIVVGQQLRGFAIGGGVHGVWVATTDQVWEIDPQTNDVIGMHDVGETTGAVAAGEGSVWVTGVLSGLGRLDAITGRRDRGFDVGMILCSGCISVRGGKRAVGGPWSGDHQRGASQSVAAGLGSVWAVGAPPPSGPSSVWRIDPSTGSSIPIRAEFPLVGVAVGEGVVWAVGANGVVARIDPETNEVVKLIGTKNGATEVAVGLSAIWVLNPMVGTVTRIDPGSSAVVATIGVGKGTTALAVGEGSVWVMRRAG